MRLRVLVPVISVSLTVATIAAQPLFSAFEVTSVRRNLSGPPGTARNPEVIDVMSDGIRIQNATLLSVIRYVYGVPLRREDLIVGGPDWLLLAARKSGTGPPPDTTQCATMAELIVRLERELQTTVVDRTGLTGRWDYALVYIPDVNHSRFPGVLPLPPELRRIPSDAPALLTAIREQLGLKLERTRSPVEVLAIKSAESPTEN